MAGWIHSRCVRDPPHAPNLDPCWFSGTISAPFGARSNTGNHQGVSDPVMVVTGEAKPTPGSLTPWCLGITIPSVPCRGGTERRPISTDTSARKCLSAERVVPDRVPTTLIFERGRNEIEETG
jgi:hypothetical protein